MPRASRALHYQRCKSGNNLYLLWLVAGHPSLLVSHLPIAHRSDRVLIFPFPPPDWIKMQAFRRCYYFDEFGRVFIQIKDLGTSEFLKTLLGNIVLRNVRTYCLQNVLVVNYFKTAFTQHSIYCKPVPVNTPRRLRYLWILLTSCNLPTEKSIDVGVTVLYLPTERAASFPAYYITARFTSRVYHRVAFIEIIISVWAFVGLDTKTSITLIIWKYSLLPEILNDPHDNCRNGF